MAPANRCDKTVRSALIRGRGMVRKCLKNQLHNISGFNSSCFAWTANGEGAEVAGGKLRVYFKLTLCWRSSNKDKNGIKLRRVPDEEHKVPLRMRADVSFIHN